MKIFFWSVGILAVFSLVFFIFVPAFQGRMEIDPVIHLGPLQLRWYGLIMAISVLVGYFLARKNSWRFGISKETIDDYSFWLVLVGILGARIYFVIFNYGYFSGNISETYKIWHGGLSIYGGVLAGLLFTYFYSKNKAFAFSQLFDLIALSLPLAQAIGRLGNFVNQEAYGTTTELPWKMYVKSTGSYHHPAFLYEMILDVAVFFVLRKLIGRAKTGHVGLTYLLLYSLGRFFIEPLRLDSFFIRSFRVDQVIAFLIIIVSGSVILMRQKRD